MRGKNTFLENNLGSLGVRGGAVGIFDGHLTLSGHALFARNKADLGGAIYASDSHISCIGGSIILDGNEAELYGGGIFMANTSLEREQCILNFFNNVAFAGGGAGIGIDNIEFNYKQVALSGNFTNNTAKRGGAVLVERDPLKVLLLLVI